MVKIVEKTQDKETSKKAKRILTSVKAATLAGLITVGSLGFANSTKAEQVAHKDLEGGYETELIDDLDEKFTWEFDDGIERDSKAVPTQTVEAPTQVPANETETVQAPTSVPTTSNTNPVSNDAEVKTSGKYIRVNILDGTYSWVDEKKDDDPEYEYLLYLDDIDPATIDEHYTGVAPLTYYGPEHVVKNYGDASNDEEVMERAHNYWLAFHKANEDVGGLKIVDPTTGKEYTEEKIANVIRYMNGAFVAKEGVEAKEVNDDWINFMLAFLNDDYVIEDVNYKANSDVISEEDVKKHNNILEYVDLGHLLMGDSSNGPFIQWFGDRIKEMYTTTDREEAIRIYDETYLALIAITEGNGYIVNGVKYTLADFSNLNDLVLDTQVLISQVLRNNMMESGYAFNKKYVGLDMVFLTDVLNQFNPVCSEDLVEYLMNNGVEVYEGVVKHGNGEDLNLRNYASVMQMKAFDGALSNGTYGIKYYQDSYLTHYDEYVNEKNGGTYEDVLESDYVYTKK